MQIFKMRHMIVITAVVSLVLSSCAIQVPQNMLPTPTPSTEQSEPAAQEAAVASSEQVSETVDMPEAEATSAPVEEAAATEVPAEEAVATEAPAEEAATSEAPAEEAAASAPLVLPEITPGKFNVAYVYVGPIGDGGWTYAHDQGRLIVEQYLSDKVSTGYVESVPEGDPAVEVIRELANRGFDAIFTTSFGFMDPTATIAEEFPDKFFVHVSGFKKNGKNFANMFGSMENIKYLTGMIAGARAKEDGSNRVGYVASFPIPEVTRYVNATAMGMRQTCPECTMDLRWTFSWFDPDGEANAATEMLDEGATVIVSGVDGTGPVRVAGERGLWGIGYDSNNACDVDIEHCLTTAYWDWGQVYIWLINKMLEGKFEGTDYYFETTSNGMGLLGFMIGQEPAENVPEWVIPEVQQILDQMLDGSYDRFNIFTGPIKNNKGEIIVQDGAELTQSDLEGLQGIRGRESCTICMSWLVEGIDPSLDFPQ